MKIVFVNRYFHPDHSATSQLLTDLALYLAARGFLIEVLTSTHLSDNPRAALPDAQREYGLLVHRVSGSRFGRHGLGGRLIDSFSFGWNAFRRLRRTLSPGDCVVAMTDPPLISVPAALAARASGAAFINWLQDLFPEVAERLRVPIGAGILGGPAARLRDWSLRQAVANVVVCTGMHRHCQQRGLPSGTLRIIRDWTDDGTVRPLAPADNPMRVRWGLGDAFVIGYSGNLGRAHEFKTLVRAAVRLRAHRDLVFLFIGGGALMNPLRQEVAARRLGSFRFEPYQPRANLWASLTVPDVHLVILRPTLEGLVLPSKFYGAAAAGRPVLYIGDPAGEVARMISDAGAGWTLASGDAIGLAALILDLRTNPARCQEAGSNARHLLEREFSASGSLGAWGALLAPWKP